MVSVKVIHKALVRTPDGFLRRSIYKDGRGNHYISWLSCGRGLVRLIDGEWIWNGEPYENKSRR